jgi:hypothetical protein
MGDGTAHFPRVDRKARRFLGHTLAATLDELHSSAVVLRQGDHLLVAHADLERIVPDVVPHRSILPAKSDKGPMPSPAAVSVADHPIHADHRPRPATAQEGTR